MAIPEIRMTFDDTNLSTFIKELLGLNEGVELVHKRFDSKIFFKCVGNIENVREDILLWLNLRSVGKEPKNTYVEEGKKETDEPSDKSTPREKIDDYMFKKKNKDGK